MRLLLAVALLPLATLAASAQISRSWVGPTDDSSYVAALEALDRGNGRAAVQLLDGLVADFPADAHAAFHEAQLRLAESYLLLGQPDSTEALIARAWAVLERGGPMVFSGASDERVVQLMERVATAGRPELALRLALMREARGATSRSALRLSYRVAIGAIPEGTGLVLYAVSPSMRRVVLITATSAGVRAAALAVSDSLAAQVAEVWTSLASGDVPDAQLARLGDALVRPLPSALFRSVDRISIVPGGALKAVPFDLLPVAGGDPLIDRYEVSIAPSATQALVRWAAPTSRLGIRVVAVAYAGTERVAGAAAAAQVRELSRFARRADVYVASEATEAAIRHADLRSAGLLHLAVPLREEPSAGEVLEFVGGDGDDGMLTSSEVAELKLGSPLVLLADCPSRQEPQLEGAVLPPVAGSFLQAGAGAVLWCSRRQAEAVVDAFVQALYRELAAGESVGSAVRRAKQARRLAGASAAEWSTFVLYGDARSTVPLRQPGARLVWWVVAVVVAVGLIWVSERQLRRTPEA